MGVCSESWERALQTEGAKSAKLQVLEKKAKQRVNYSFAQKVFHKNLVLSIYDVGLLAVCMIRSGGIYQEV